MQFWIILCIVFELLSELKMSEKFKPHFAFLTGIITVAVILGAIMERFGENPVSLQESVETELQKWQVYVESYEISDEMKRQLMEAQQQYEQELYGEGREKMQEKLQGVMEKYGCTITDVIYDGEKNCIQCVVRKEKSGGITVEKIEINHVREEEERENMRQDVEELLEAEGEKVEVDIIFKEG